MRDLADLLNEMCRGGVVDNYAIFGAVAQMRYTEPVATLDADVLVSVPVSEGLDVRAPINGFCAERGFHPEGEAIRIGEWPVRFIPAFDPLTRRAQSRPGIRR